MLCRRVQTHFDAYIDAELPTAQRIQLEAHLDGCGECRDALSRLEHLRCEPQTPSDPPPEFWAPMHEAVLKEYNEIHPASPPKNTTWMALYAIIFIAVIGWTFYQPSAKDSVPTASQTHSSTSNPPAFRQ